MKLIDILNDKGYKTDKHTSHNYIQDYYDQAFEPYKDLDINFLEIGVLDGESMKLWSDYFTNPKNIVGIDIFVRVSKQQVEWNLMDYEVKLHTINSHGRDGFHGEYPQSDDDKFEEFKERYGGFDIIVEDGHHGVNSQVNTYNRFSSLVNEGGIYIIEDIQQQNVPVIKKQIPNIEILISNGDSFKNQPFGVIKY